MMMNGREMIVKMDGEMMIITKYGGGMEEKMLVRNKQANKNKKNGEMKNEMKVEIK